MQLIRCKRRNMEVDVITPCFRAVCGLVYYGVAFAAGDLGGMKYRDFVLASISDLAGTFACLYILKR